MKNRTIVGMVASADDFDFPEADRRELAALRLPEDLVADIRDVIRYELKLVEHGSLKPSERIAALAPIEKHARQLKAALDALTPATSDDLEPGLFAASRDFDVTVERIRNDLAVLALAVERQRAHDEAKKSKERLARRRQVVQELASLFEGAKLEITGAESGAFLSTLRIVHRALGWHVHTPANDLQYIRLSGKQ